MDASPVPAPAQPGQVGAGGGGLHPGQPGQLALGKRVAAERRGQHGGPGRVADHLVDHRHEVEALLAGAEPLPDEWHGRAVTLDADWVRFTEPDYAEACSRLRRLGRWYLRR